MSAHGPVQAVNINDLKQFSSEARVNLPLIKSKDLVTRINCYEPGQITPPHLHPDDDEIVFCVEGRGAAKFEDHEAVPLQPGSIVCLPAGQLHWLEAAADSRMVLVYWAKAGYTSVRPRPAPGVAGVRLPGEEPR
jgi:quercetin dioxygenase-like cupin family protein